MDGTYQSQRGAAIHAAEPDTVRRVRTLCGRVFKRTARLQRDGNIRVTCAICLKRLAKEQPRREGGREKADRRAGSSPSSLLRLPRAQRAWHGPRRYATPQQLTAGLLAQLNTQLAPLNLFLELQLPSGQLRILDYRDKPAAAEQLRKFLKNSAIT